MDQTPAATNVPPDLRAMFPGTERKYRQVAKLPDGTEGPYLTVLVRPMALGSLLQFRTAVESIAAKVASAFGDPGAERTWLRWLRLAIICADEALPMVQACVDGADLRDPYLPPEVSIDLIATWLAETFDPKKWAGLMETVASIQAQARTAPASNPNAVITPAPIETGLDPG